MLCSNTPVLCFPAKHNLDTTLPYCNYSSLRQDHYSIASPSHSNPILIPMKLLVALCLLAGILPSLAERFPLTPDGSATPAPQPKHRKNKKATFRNEYTNETLGLFWVSTSSEEVIQISEIPPGSEINVDTTESHIFTARGLQTDFPAEPNMITVDEAEEYTFRPFRRQEERPFIRTLGVHSTSASAKFRCLVPGEVDVWYHDGGDGIYQGTLSLGKEYTVNSYDGHVFYFTEKGNKQKEYARFTVDPNRVIYVVRDPLRPPPQHMLDHLEKEIKFSEEYFAKTGLQWRHYFGPDGPRPPPIHHMWPADYIGQKHKVVTDDNDWICAGKESVCKLQGVKELELEVISLKPRAFLIRNFLSGFEADALVSIGRKRVEESWVGNNDAGGQRKSDTRTSRNTWIGRPTNGITESLYSRAQVALNISRLDYRNTEDIQLVHYSLNQRYDAHHDWGVSGHPESRFATLLLYLNDMASPYAGGETSFPKGNDGLGIKIHAGKGNAMLFYDLLEDGNADDLSLHAALPLKEGEKWLANFWVWDPQRK